MKFVFKNKSLYPMQVFEIERYHEADPTNSSVWLKCVTDPSIQLNRFVNMSELELL